MCMCMCMVYVYVYAVVHIDSEGAGSLSACGNWDQIQVLKIHLKCLKIIALLKYNPHTKLVKSTVQ